MADVVLFTRTSIARQGAFPPDDHHARERLWQHVRSRLFTRLNPCRRARAAPRVIKRKMPEWHVKRSHHATWPQPNQNPTYHISRP